MRDNAHDIDAFLATYADDAQLFEHPAKLLARGQAEMRGSTSRPVQRA